MTQSKCLEVYKIPLIFFLHSAYLSCIVVFHSSL